MRLLFWKSVLPYPYSQFVVSSQLSSSYVVVTMWFRERWSLQESWHPILVSGPVLMLYIDQISDWCHRSGVQSVQSVYLFISTVLASFYFKYSIWSCCCRNICSKWSQHKVQIVFFGVHLTLMSFKKRCPARFTTSNFNSNNNDSSLWWCIKHIYIGTSVSTNCISSSKVCTVGVSTWTGSSRLVCVESQSELFLSVQSHLFVFILNWPSASNISELLSSSNFMFNH